MQKPGDNIRIVLMGSSTGGPAVVETILTGLDPQQYSVLIAQHMPEGFTAKWAERLNKLTPFDVTEGAQGDLVLAGRAFVAPGNRHLKLSERTDYRLSIDDGPHVNRFRPSIDVLFESAVNYPPEKIYAVMLTGMCADGVRGIIKLRERGAVTIAQDEKSSAVFGMNKEAIDRGGIEYVMSPAEMIEYLNRN